jgi:hypothetical protein
MMLFENELIYIWLVCMYLCAEVEQKFYTKECNFTLQLLEI